ncbi:MAG: esterase-like activity of phytase family protein [Pseudomonadota bacterium]
MRVANTLFAGVVFTSLILGQSIAMSQEITVEVLNAETPYLRLLNTWQLKVSGIDDVDPGFSGLDIHNGKLLAVGDNGLLFEAELLETEDGLVLGSGAIRLLTTEDGDALHSSKSKRDAEALARLNGELFVAFERDHRISRLHADDTLSSVLSLKGRDLKGIKGNNGVEALAAVPNQDVLLAFGQKRIDGQVHWWHFDLRGETPRSGTLNPPGREEVAGADVGPDGKLYLLRRDHRERKKQGAHDTRIVVERFRMTDGVPDADSREELGRFSDWRPFETRGVGVDNVEGIAVVRQGEALNLWLVSDDNGSDEQRSLLMRFEIVN